MENIELFYNSLKKFNCMAIEENDLSIILLTSDANILELKNLELKKILEAYSIDIFFAEMLLCEKLKNKDKKNKPYSYLRQCK